VKKLSPSGSYDLDLPDDISEQYDDRVSSFWRPGEPMLLQLSSHVRESGSQVSAADRPRERIAALPSGWAASSVRLHVDAHIDQATAEPIDEKGLLWLHTYIVWPKLAVYVAISGPREAVEDPDNWAIRAVRSLSLNSH